MQRDSERPSCTTGKQAKHIRTAEMNSNNSREKLALNKAKKNLQLFVKNCNLGGLNALNGQSLRDFIRHRSKLLERAKDKVLRYVKVMNTLWCQILYSLFKGLVQIPLFNLKQKINSLCSIFLCICS